MNARISYIPFFMSVVFVLVGSAFGANIIHVPGDQPTIQAGINAAGNGDTVLVAPGTYYENINFKGKPITVKSSSGAKVTIIDGGGVASVAIFSSGETLNSVLSGFTLQNGNSTDGGGILIASSSPTIKNNIIQNNMACSGGAGIAVEFASPLIQGNIIRSNKQSGCSGGTGGGGILVGGAGSARIIGNTIKQNTWPGFGGGISLFAAGTPTLSNNIVSGNSSVGGEGGGMWLVNNSDALIVQNLIYNNNASHGSGVYFLVPSGSRGPLLVNNTVIAGTGATQGAAVFAAGFDNQVQLYNNLLIGLSGQNAVYCDNSYSSIPPSFVANDAFSPSGTGLQGTCLSQSGANGNISATPNFVAKANFRLKDGSPAIDAGKNSAPNLPTKDLANNTRIINGKGLTTAIVDMGAYEFVPVLLAPKSISYGLHSVGSTTSRTVKLTNNLNKVVNISSYSVPTGYSVTGCGTSVAAFASCTLTITFHPLTVGKYNGLLVVNDDAGNTPQTVSLSGSAK